MIEHSKMVSAVNIAIEGESQPLCTYITKKCATHSVGPRLRTVLEQEQLRILVIFFRVIFYYEKSQLLVNITNCRNIFFFPHKQLKEEHVGRTLQKFCGVFVGERAVLCSNSPQYWSGSGGNGKKGCRCCKLFSQWRLQHKIVIASVFLFLQILLFIRLHVFWGSCKYFKNCFEPTVVF